MIVIKNAGKFSHSLKNVCSKYKSSFFTCFYLDACSLFTIPKTILYIVLLIMKTAQSNTHPTHFVIENRINLVTQASN